MLATSPFIIPVLISAHLWSLVKALIALIGASNSFPNTIAFSFGNEGDLHVVRDEWIFLYVRLHKMNIALFYMHCQRTARQARKSRKSARIDMRILQNKSKISRKSEKEKFEATKKFFNDSNRAKKRGQTTVKIWKIMR